MTEVKTIAVEETNFSKSETCLSIHNLSDAMGEKTGAHIDLLRLFTTTYNCYPHLITIHNVDALKAIPFLEKKYFSDIKDTISTKRPYGMRTDTSIAYKIFLLQDDLVVGINVMQDTAHILYKNTPSDIIETIEKEITAIKKVKYKDDPMLGLLLMENGSVNANWFHIKKTNLSVVENYNDDFLTIHKLILKRIAKRNDKGLLLLHGKPGTGKTTYIRYLIGQIKKNVLFIPNSIALNLTNPEMVKMMMNNKNGVFVIEDAETLLLDRNNYQNSAVANLLNLTDGLLSDVFNVQIICTFNTDIKNLDKALLRKGRLIAMYEFKELETSKAQALSNKLGSKEIIKSPMILSEIYNQKDIDFIPKHKNQIGFFTDKMI